MSCSRQIALRSSAAASTKRLPTAAKATMRRGVSTSSNISAARTMAMIVPNSRWVSLAI
jgi:hypothetical protein